MPIYSKLPFLSPDINTQRPRTQAPARGAITPPAGAQFSNAAHSVYQSELQTAIPHNLTAQLLLTLKGKPGLAQFLKNTFQRPSPHTTTLRQANHLEAANALNQAVHQSLGKNPNGKQLQELAQHIASSAPAEHQTKINKYIRQATPEALKWLEQHGPEQLRKKQEFEQLDQTHMAQLIENEVERAVTSFTDSSLEPHADWGDYIRTQHLATRIAERFSIPNQHPLEALILTTLEAPKNYRVFYTTHNQKTLVIEHANLKERGAHWRKHGFQTAAAKLEKTIQTQFQQWHTQHFETATQPIQPEQVEQYANTLQNRLRSLNPFAAQYPTLLTELIRNAAQEAPPYALYYSNPKRPYIPSPHTHAKGVFYGGYFKANKKQPNPALAATQVKASNGRVYELLNTLTPEHTQQLREQHQLTKTPGKLIFGEGGYGKVRLARDTQTHELVAVKKFTQKKSAPMAYASKEIDAFGDLQTRINATTHPERINKSLDQLLGFAHLMTVDSNSSFKPLIAKSYLFTPLANQGDGVQAAKHIAQLRQQGQHTLAHQHFLHIATQYAEAVSNLHALDVHHRDIKPGNFLHSHGTHPATQQVRLADFGTLQNEASADLYMGGTPSYIPPEAQGSHINKSYQAEKHDTFSLGLSLLELNLGERPCKITNRPHLLLQKTDGTPVPIALQFDEFERCKGIDPSLLHNLAPHHIDNVVAQLLSQTPEHRLSAQEAHQQLTAIEGKA